MYRVCLKYTSTLIRKYYRRIYHFFERDMTRKVTMVEKVRWLMKDKGAGVFNSIVAKLRQVKIHWILVLVFLTCLLSGFGIIAGTRVNVAILGSGGNIKVDGVGVYSDRGCSVAIAFLDWGTLEPGSMSNNTVYIRNEGNHASTLYLDVANWNPISAANYMIVSWNYDGRILNSQQNVEVKLTLSVSQEIGNISSFSFDLIIGVVQ
jgi:hypothetical protein